MYGNIKGQYPSRWAITCKLLSPTCLWLVVSLSIWHHNCIRKTSHGLTPMVQSAKKARRNAGRYLRLKFLYASCLSALSLLEEKLSLADEELSVPLVNATAPPHRTMPDSRQNQSSMLISVDAAASALPCAGPCMANVD